MVEVDIDEIIELTKVQEPGRLDLINAIYKCKNGYWSSTGYYRFVDSTNANKPGAEWQHSECIIIEDTSNGNIVIDLLKDGRIGGFEFLKLL